MPTYRVLPTTHRFTEQLEAQGIFFEDILRLHQFGFLNALPLPKNVITRLRQELDATFQEDVPSQLQLHFYRVAMVLIKNDPNLISTFIAPRLHYDRPGYTDPSDINVRWNFHQQEANPNPIDYHISHPIHEPRPRLIDRMNPLTDAEIISHLNFIKDRITKPQYNSFYRHYFNDLSFTAIAKARNCSSSNIAAACHTAIRKIRWQHQIQNAIFGKNTLGAICKSTS